MLNQSNIFDKLKNIIFPKKITTLEELEKFISIQVGDESGKLVMKYAQKRLGKIHYMLSKDINYVAEIVDCQIKVQVELLSDYFAMLGKLFNIATIKENEKLTGMLYAVHNNYVASSPVKRNPILEHHHLTKKNISLRELANNTATKIYSILPMTENLHKTNVDIFKGQIRLLYVDMLQKLSVRLDKNSINTMLIEEV